MDHDNFSLSEDITPKGVVNNLNFPNKQRCDSYSGKLSYNPPIRKSDSN